MPRQKKVVLGTQFYNLPAYGPLAKVTIEYDVANPPPFFQPAPGVVIVGEHFCAPQTQRADFSVVETNPILSEVRRRAAPRGGNFEVDPNDPSYLAFKAGLAAGPEPAPPDVSPRVITSQDLLNSTPGFEQVDLRAVIAGAPLLATGTEGE